MPTTYVRFARDGSTTSYGMLDGESIAALSGQPWGDPQPTGETFRLDDVRLLAPTEPRSVVCVGLNYSSHLGGRPAPDPPTLFFKPLSSLIGPGEAIVLPAGAGRIDPEGEIVIVIGREVSRASRSEAQRAIFGYTAGNDVSAREWQAGDGQWWRAKGADTFGAFGPAVVAGVDYAGLEVFTRVNGDQVQHGGAGELIIDIPGIVEFVSATMTLVPGDIIYTGTPGQPREINPGDVVEIEVPGAGILRNPVIAARP